MDTTTEMVTTPSLVVFNRLNMKNAINTAAASAISLCTVKIAVLYGFPELVNQSPEPIVTKNAMQEAMVF